MRSLAWLGRDKGRFTSLPLAGGWTEFRDFPAPQGQTFQQQWKSRRAGSGR
jgi:L-lactate dehydrogenase complex protein LldF